MNRSTRFASVLALLIAVVPATPAGASARPVRCPHVRGTVVLSTSRVLVARHTSASGRQVLKGCVKTHGVVRNLGSSPDEGLGSGTITAVAAVGTWVRVDVTGYDQYHIDRASWLINVATARGYLVLSYSAENADPSPGPHVDSFLWDARGRSATAIGTPTGVDANGNPTAVDEAIAVHAPDGTTVVADHGPPDSVPAASLTFQGDIVGWTHDGQARSVTFS